MTENQEPLSLLLNSHLVKKESISYFNHHFITQTLSIQMAFFQTYSIFTGNNKK